MERKDKINHKRNYAFAIMTVVALILLNQIVIQYWLSQKESDAAIINVSGKQRMLSQRILSLYYSQKENPSQIRTKLFQTLNEWENAHSQLLGLNGISNLKIEEEKIRHKLSQLTPNIEFANRFVNGGIPKKNIIHFEKNQNDFLFQMDQIVKEIQVSSEQKLMNIIWIEILLTGLVLVVLFLEYKMVFKKIAGDLSDEVDNLARSNSSLEQYAFIASHDLRAPLQNIVNFSGLLTRELKKENDHKKLIYANFINDSVKRMQATTKDLLDFSTASHKELERKPTNIKSLFEDVLSDIKALVEKSDAKIMANELPLKAHVDDTLFRQLMQNLISNAIKFVPEERNPEVRVFAKKDKGKLIFCVSDNGIGIPDESKERIFGLYKRLHNQREYKGTGIGLALCKKIVEKHEGNIWVEDNTDNGSAFYFEIPENK